MAVTGDIRQYVEAGTLRALAVTSAQRSRFLPDVPTFAELGFDKVTGVDWYGLFAIFKLAGCKIEIGALIARIIGDKWSFRAIDWL